MLWRRMTCTYVIVNMNKHYLIIKQLNRIYLLFLIQVIASMQYQCIFFGFTILYAVMVCVACSQLEKLTAKLCDIKQNGFTSEDDSIREDGNNEKGEPVSESYIQTTLNECVQLHQFIMRYVYAYNINNRC